MPSIDSNALASNYIDLLDAIYELESSSGKNPKAYVMNKVGALGGYQMRKSTYEGDLQKMYPSKWASVPFEKAMKNDIVAREAANDYLSLLNRYLTSFDVVPSEDTLLAAYHQGAGNVAKGNIGPIGKEYVQKGLEFIARKRKNG